MNWQNGGKHLQHKLYNKVKNFPGTLSLPFAVFMVVNISAAQPKLKDVFKEYFYVGAALNDSQFTGKNIAEAALVVQQFNSITPENVLKWERVHPKSGVYEFTLPDQYVAFGEKHGMFIIGHNLVWHSQTPTWVFEDSAGNPVNKDVLLERMKDHIQTVVGRYKGRIKGWDVVNEALNEDGSYRQSKWLNIIGEDYLVKAFEFAHEADPNAELYYNDYSIENEPKRNGVIHLIKMLQSHNITVTGIGLQGHYKLDWPAVEQIDSTLNEFKTLGVKAMITELDVDVIPATQIQTSADVDMRRQWNAAAKIYVGGLPDSVQQLLAKRYGDFFRIFVRHSDIITRVTFWGVTDRDSWLNSWGRVNYPLLFDRKGEPKPAFNAVVKTAAH
jgi:endo-1,4-beta-xylanase